VAASALAFESRQLKLDEELTADFCVLVTARITLEAEVSTMRLVVMSHSCHLRMHKTPIFKEIFRPTGCLCHR